MVLIAGRSWKGDGGKSLVVLQDDLEVVHNSESQLKLVTDRINTWVGQNLPITLLFDDTGGGLQAADIKTFPYKLMKWVESKQPSIRVVRLLGRLRHLGELSSAIQTLTKHMEPEVFRKWCSGDAKLQGLSGATWFQCLREVEDFFKDTVDTKDSARLLAPMLKESKDAFNQINEFFSGARQGKRSQQVLHVFRTGSEADRGLLGSLIVLLDSMCLAVQALRQLDPLIRQGRVLLVAGHTHLTDVKLDTFVPVLGVQQTLKVDPSSSPPTPPTHQTAKKKKKKKKKKGGGGGDGGRAGEVVEVLQPVGEQKDEKKKDEKKKEEVMGVGVRYPMAEGQLTTLLNGLNKSKKKKKKKKHQPAQAASPSEAS